MDCLLFVVFVCGLAWHGSQSGLSFIQGVEG